jgi:flagellar hook-basal body complex protein FliE
MMSITFNAATSAYGQTQKLISDIGAKTTQVNPTEEKGGGFADMLSENVQSVVDAGRVSDQASLDLVNGNANIVDVVSAIAETEIAIESMVTIRDRVIKAYEEIMRMPI